MGDEDRPCRPLLFPELFLEKATLMIGSHILKLASINGWDDAAKLQWMSVRMMGWAQTSFCRFPESVRGSYSAAKQALLERFEPPAKKGMYAAELRRTKLKVGEILLMH